MDFTKMSVSPDANNAIPAVDNDDFKGETFPNNEFVESNNEGPVVLMSKPRLITLFIGPAIAADLAAIDKILWVAIVDLLTAVRRLESQSPCASIAITIINPACSIYRLPFNQSDIISVKERGRYVGVVGSVFSVGSIIGPLLGGAFSDNPNLTWRWVFYINLPLGAIPVLFITFLLSVPTPPGTLREKLARIDWWGTLTVSGSTLAILLALQWGGSSYSWDSALVITLFVVGGLGYILFAYIEGFVAAEPIVPVGSVIGLSAFSAIINNALIQKVVGILKNQYKIDVSFGDIHQNLTAIFSFGEPLRSELLGVILDSLHKIFLIGLIASVMLFVSALFMRNRVKTEKGEGR
ncbi:3198_t:CDS:2 [Acaulospora colombiana]|uniref:3198_t:CDS:1 n=1 Tax=Acaulospora colombiana TaxID=27376 RepID=A0ACA9LQN3_9GLOM|nr:3198_t:CDS:2 [Acaulospora colombiana]